MQAGGQVVSYNEVIEMAGFSCQVKYHLRARLATPQGDAAQHAQRSTPCTAQRAQLPLHSAAF